MKKKRNIIISNLKIFTIIIIIIFIQIVFVKEIKAQNGIIIDDADFISEESLTNSTDLDNVAQEVDPKITVEYADAVITNELFNSTNLDNVAQDLDPKITVEYADGIMRFNPDGSQDLSDLAQNVDPRIIVEYADGIIENGFGSTVSSIGILNFYESLMDIDPLTRDLLKGGVFYIVSRLGSNIWDFLTPDKIYLEYNWDISKSGDKLFGFAPTFRVRLWLWKEGNEIHVKLEPKINFNPDEDSIIFMGPLASLQKMMNNLITGKNLLKKFNLEWEFNFGAEGYFEWIWDTATNDMSFDLNFFKMWGELIVKGQYLPWLLSLFNPLAAELLRQADYIFEKVSDTSILDLCTGEFKLKIEASTGFDSDGFYFQLDVKPKLNFLVLDIDLDGDPELEASVRGSCSFKWNRLGFGWAGGIKLRLMLNLKFDWFLPLKDLHMVWEDDLVTFDTELYTEGGGAASLLNLASENRLDTDLDGLIDYYEKILGTSINNIDSDNDKVSDYYEVIYGTNPLSSDTDNDQLSDYSEIAIYNTNPLEEDTDKDGILDFHEISGTYGGIFTSPIFNDTDQDGLSDSEESKTFNSSNPGTNASAYDSDGDGYSDGDEVNKYSTDPLNSLDIPTDTDSDGIPDIDEILIGTDPNIDEYSIDSDFDDIPDIIEELLFKTNPTLLDSDYDGFNDGSEILNGTNPNNPLDYPGANYTYPDTDREGLPDIIEYYLFFTNHTLSDTDGDSYNDFEEIVWGSDPNDAFSIPGFLYHSNFDDIDDIEEIEDPEDQEKFPIIPGYDMIVFMILLAGTALIAILKKIKAKMVKNKFTF